MKRKRNTKLRFTKRGGAEEDSSNFIREGTTVMYNDEPHLITEVGEGGGYGGGHTLGEL